MELQLLQDESAAPTAAFPLGGDGHKPRKSQNIIAREHFDVFLELNGKTKSLCKHCKKWMQVAQVVNVSKLVAHVQKCANTPLNIRSEVAKSTQDGSKRAKCIGNESISSPRPPAPDTGPEPGHRFGLGNFASSLSTSSLMDPFVHHMTKEKAEGINLLEVEASVARFEPMSRFDCPFVRLLFGDGLLRGHI